MYEICCVAIKDLRLLVRDKGGLFWVIGWPLINAILFGMLFSGGGSRSGGLSLAVVDNDRTPLSSAYVAELKKNKALTVSEVPFEEARDKVRKGSVVASLSINEGFDENMTGLFGDAGKPALELLVDPSRTAEQGYLQGMLIQSRFTVLQSKFLDVDFAREQIDLGIASIESAPGIDAVQAQLLKGMLESVDRFFDEATSDTLANSPFGSGDGSGGGMSFEIPVVGVEREANPNNPPTAFSITFPSGMLWALLACCATFAVSLIQERERGTLRRLRIAPIRSMHVLMGKALACFVACIVVLTCLLIIGKVGFKLTIRSPLHFGISALLSAYCFVGLMMLLSTLGKTERSVSGSSWGILLMIALFGGGMVPLMMMPPFMRNLTMFSPGRWAVNALEGGIWRPLTAVELLTPWGVLLMLGTVFLGAGIAILRRSEGKG